MLGFSVPRPTWHYVFRNGVEQDYPIVDDGLRPVTLRAAVEHPEDIETISLRLGDSVLAYATVKDPPRVGVATGVVFDIPEDAVLYHAICRNKVANAGVVEQHWKWPSLLKPAPSLQAGSGFVLGWRNELAMRRMEVYIDDERRRIDVEPYPIELTRKAKAAT